MLKWLPYVLIDHCTSLSPWFIILDNNNFVNVSDYYISMYSKQTDTVGSYLTNNTNIPTVGHVKAIITLTVR